MILPCTLRENKKRGLWNIFQTLDDSRVVLKIMKRTKIDLCNILLHSTHNVLSPVQLPQTNHSFLLLLNFCLPKVNVTQPGPYLISSFHLVISP